MGKTGSGHRLVPYAIGFAPALLVALTWSPSGNWFPFELIMRGYSAPIIGAELFVIIVALREGLLSSLPRWNWGREVVVAASILLVVAVATAFVAPARAAAIMLTAYWLIHATFGLSVAHLCGRVFCAGELVEAYMVGFAVFAVEFFAFLRMIPDWGSFDWKYGFMAFSHIRHAGYYLAAMATLSMGAMAVSERLGGWLWAWATASIAFGIALWTGSRGAALAVAGALVVSVVLVPAVRSVRAWGGSLASMAIAIAVVSQAPAAPNYLLGLARAVRASGAEDVTTGRLTIWKNVISAIRERPIFGYGEGQMHTVAPFSVMAQPHDSVLQVTLAWGLVGLACILTLTIAYGRRALPAVRHEAGALVPLFMAIIALAILSLYDGSLYYALPQSIFIACAAVIASGWSGSHAGRGASVVAS